MADYFDFFIPRFAEKADRSQALSSGISLIQGDGDISQELAQVREDLESCKTLERGYRAASTIAARNLERLRDLDRSLHDEQAKSKAAELAEFDTTSATLAKHVKAAAGEVSGLNDALSKLDEKKRPTDADKLETRRLKTEIRKLKGSLKSQQAALDTHLEDGPQSLPESAVLRRLRVAVVLSEAVEVFDRACDSEFYRRRASDFVHQHYELIRASEQDETLAEIRTMLVETLCVLAVLKKSAMRGLPNFRGLIRAIAALVSAADQSDMVDARDLDFQRVCQLMAMPVAFPRWANDAKPCDCVHSDGSLADQLLKKSLLEQVQAIQRYQRELEAAREKCENARENGEPVEECNCEPDECCIPQNPCCIELNSYVMDLMTVRETIDGYEPGDLAHIQNKMAGESISRTHELVTETETYLETERTSRREEERDLQTSERFELQNAVQTIVDRDLATDAGITTSGKYGTAGQFTATANVAYSSSRSESRQSAQNYAKELTERAISKIQEETRELNTQRSLRRTTETNVHEFKASDDHLSGIYYWVNKRSISQVMNWGRRLMYEFVVPEPALLYKDLLRRKSAKSTDLPEELVVDFELSEITDDADQLDYRKLARRFAITDVAEPPEETILSPYTVDIPGQAATAVTIANVPAGYTVEKIVNHAGPTTLAWIGDQHFLSASGTFSPGWTFSVDTVLDAMIWNLAQTPSRGSGLVTMRRGPQALRSWQADVYDQVLAAAAARAAERKLAMSERASQAIPSTHIRGNNPFLNREIERTQLWQHVVSMLSCQYFDQFKAMKRHVQPCGYPQLDFVEAQEEGALIQFFEQVFDVQQMMYLFYPYFWGNKGDWPQNIGTDSGDSLFDRFLEAGAARITMPVRPGMEPLALYYEQTGEIWMGTGTPDYDPNSAHFLAMHEEIKSRSANFQQDRPGLLDIDFKHYDSAGALITDPNNSGDPLGHNGTLVAVHGTDHWWDWTAMTVSPNVLEDIDREIIIARNSYRIVDIQLDEGFNTPANAPTATNVPTAPTDQNAAFIMNMRWIITLAQPVPKQDPNCKDRPFPLTNLKWSVGAIYVGAEWENLIPTSMTWLQPGGPSGSYDNCLPCYPVKCP